MVVPNATIHTLREFMESPEKTRPYLSKLDPTSKLFFETQFFASVYDDTRQQILTRLWGVISNSVLARMFSHTRNAVDLFSALNRGSLILINTLSIYQFSRHPQSFGSGRHLRRSLMARRRPRVSQESLPRASLAG